MNHRRVMARDNPLLVRVRKLVQSPTAYRKLGQIWVEGEHLCAAAVARGVPVALAIGTEAALEDAGLADLLDAAAQVVVIPAPLFAGISGLASPAQIGFMLDAPVQPVLRQGDASIVLDGVQDAGNVGSVLRSASAMGVRQVLALKGTAAMWSPKVLRAAMGAHFNLHLIEGLQVEDLSALQMPLVATSSHAELSLPDCPLPNPCVWAFGHEGQGVSAAVQALCAISVRIPQPGGEESLNVAAAAAVCLYEGARQARTQ